MPLSDEKRVYKILLVEDNEHDQAAFRRALSKDEFEFEVVIYKSADEALGHLGQDPPDYDVIVTDYNLPGMNGLELCHELLRLEYEAPLVILTGSGSENTAVEAIKSGVYDYLVKDPANGYLRLLPVVLVEVVSRFNDRLARQEAEREKERLIVELRTALNEVKKLSGLLPICSSCKRIRDSRDYWLQVDEYISQHSEVTFTHGLCPDCIKQLYPEMAGSILNGESDPD
jgi:DNA-binding NtrC family response regulator